MRSIIFLDIDGCLISQNGNVGDNYYKSLAWLAGYISKANVAECPNICLCSGRNAVFTEAISYLIGWPQFPIIAENGAVFYYPLTREFRLNPEISLTAKKTLEWVSSKITPVVLKNYSALSVVEGQKISVTFSKKNSKSMVSVEQMRMDIRRMISKLIRRRLLKIFVAGDSINITPAGINKGMAVKLLAQEQGIDLAHSIGIGDSKLDIPFLSKTGLVGCPENADNCCKKFIREQHGRVSHFSHAEGVVDIIKWFTQS